MLLYMAAGITFAWIIGMVTSFTFGGIIHVLPILALTVLVLKFDNGRRICG